jgi:hypothetical protein
LNRTQARRTKRKNAHLPGVLLVLLLISLGGWFDVYSIFLTGTIAPGLFADKIFAPTAVAFFGFTGLASFIAAMFSGLFIGTLFLTRVAAHDDGDCFGDRGRKRDRVRGGRSLSRRQPKADSRHSARMSPPPVGPHVRIATDLLYFM